MVNTARKSDEKNKKVIGIVNKKLKNEIYEVHISFIKVHIPEVIVRSYELYIKFIIFSNFASGRYAFMKFLQTVPSNRSQNP